MMEYGLFLGGEWIETEEKITIRNPYNDDVVGIVSAAGKSEMNTAVEIAGEAFEIMKRMSSGERSAILADIAEKMEEQGEEFARTISLEAGKAIKSSRLEVKRAVTTFRIASEEARRINGEVLSMDMVPASRFKIGLNRRFPLGIVLGISPFNFPLNLCCHKIAPALAMGNSIIIKPASYTPLTMLMFMELIESTNLPLGALIVLPAKSSDAEYLVTCPHVKKITFTGSAEVGWRIKELSPKKKVTLELGGNAALVIHKDGDVETAARKAVQGGFVYNGQVCISVQRVFAHNDVYSRVVEIMTEETEKLIVGDQMEEESFITAMITEEEAKRVIDWIGEAVKDGASVITGNRREGSIVYPTLLNNTRPEMKVNSMEVFGPVITIEPFDKFEDAVRMVNNSRYGLQAGYFTRDINKIAYAYNETEVGGVIINDFPTFRLDHMPYGGVKDSGFGREGVRYAMDEMSEQKLLVIDTLEK